MDNEERSIGKFFITIGIVAMLILVLAGCTSQEEKREYRQAQVDMVQVQVNQRTQQGIAESQARLALYEAMAKVAETSPESADAIAVALAVSSVREESEEDQGPIVQLQREENEALAVVKAVAPALVTTLGTVGVAAIQADVNKTQSKNAARVAIADSATDADIMRSVTGMASIGLARATTQVGGDYYVADTLDQSSTQTVTENNTVTDASTSTTTNTETNTSTTTSESNNTTDNSNTTSDSNNTTSNETSSNSSTEGSYNTTDNSNTTSDSNNNTSNETSSETNTEGSYNTSDSYNDNSDNSDNSNNSNSYQSADGTLLSFDDIVALLGAGLRVEVVINGEPVEVEQAACPDGSAGLSFGGDSVVCS